MSENINIYKKHIFNINYPDEYNELIITLQGEYLDEVTAIYNDRYYNVFLAENGQFLVVKNLHNGELENGFHENLYEAIKIVDNKGIL